jgi:hypothetical protein
MLDFCSIFFLEVLVKRTDSSIRKALRGKGKNFLYIYATFSPQDFTTGAGKSTAGAVKSTAGAVESNAGAVKPNAGAVKSTAGAVKSTAGTVKSTAGAVKSTAGAVNFTANAKKPAKSVFQPYFTANKP